MAKLSIREVQSMITSSRTDALSSDTDSRLSADRRKAMNYYLGNVSEDIPDETGRSTAVSTDVADTIDGLMPVLMEIFAGGDEVVQFEPVGPEDVGAAQQETDYINHVFMQQNPGFLVLYTMIKDALLSKAGIVKVWWEKTEKYEESTFYDLSGDQFQLLVQDPDIEITEHTVNSDLHDVTIRRKRDCEKACVLGVPPEEFGIASRARNIKEAGYCYHAVPRLVGDLLEEGWDATQVKSLPTFRPWARSEELARDTVLESGIGPPGDLSEATRQVQIFEHYIEMDYDGEGLCIYKVTTGDDNVPIKRKSFDTVEKMDGGMPFAAITPVIMTHRFWGRSIADLVMDVQRIKTVLVRGLLDNLYFRNNFRTEVPETHATRNTIDDLLNSRPGGIVRTKQPGGLAPIPVEDVSQSIYPALQYFDATREWRTGLSRQGQGIDPNALQNQVATIANQMEAMSDKKIKLIARIFADTGIRDLFQLLHATVRKYGSKAQTVRLRNNWVSVDPREWRSRDDMTVKVALGTGNKAQQLAGQQLIIQAQVQGIQAGLVSRENLWNSAQELCRINGHPDAARFFVDPQAPPSNNPADAPIPPPPDPKQAEAQQKAQIEQAKIQADAVHQKLRTEQESQIEGMKLQHQAAIENLRAQNDQQIALLRAQIDREKMQHDLAKEHLKAETGIHMESMRAKPQASIDIKHNAGDVTGPLGEAIATFGKHLSDSHQNMMETQRQHMEHQNQMLHALAQHVTAPKKVIRGRDGRISHVETITH